MIDRHATRGVYRRVTPAVLGWEDGRVDDRIPWLRDQIDALRFRADSLRTMALALPPDARAYLTETAGLLLADVEAKRRILDAHPLEDPSKYVPFPYCGTCQGGDGIPTGPAPCPTQRAMALAFTSRPGYQEMWRP